MRNNDVPVKMLVVGIVLCFAVLYAFQTKDTRISADTAGTPVIITEKVDITAKTISQIAEDDQYVYLLVDRHRGIVQVYDFMGNYQRTMVFFTHPNGAFMIAVDHGAFYVRDQADNLYVFDDLQLETYLDSASAEPIIARIDFEDSASNYETRWGSLWRLSSHGEQCIVARPAYSVFYQYQLHWVIYFGAALVLMWYRLRRNDNHPKSI